VRISDAHNGGIGLFPTEMTDVNGTVFFAAGTNTPDGNELWKTDGTLAGTVMVKDINPGPGGSFPHDLQNMNGTLYFQATTPDNGTELWKSDGTADGTVMVKDINPGRGNGMPDFGPAHLTLLNGIIYFIANDGTTGLELWRTDGTADGTWMVKDIDPSIVNTNPLQAPSGLTVFNGKLYFFATTRDTGRELWTSDGTTEGTHLVVDLNPGPGNATGGSGGLTVFNGLLYFGATNGQTGFVLWQTDGTAEGTQLAANVPLASSLVPVNGRLVFASQDRDHGVEPWAFTPPPPTVQSEVINDGAAQRSMVRSITITFSGPETLSPGAFQLKNARGHDFSRDLEVASSVVNGKTVVVLTFRGRDIIGGSLPDGDYTLTIRGDRVHDAAGQALDGDGHGDEGSNHVDKFWRLFGDAEGNHRVDEFDRELFLRAYGSHVGDPTYLSFFDFDGDGAIDRLDLREFMKRFHKR
jgi:ELWxxDGT repeat protein